MSFSDTPYTNNLNLKIVIYLWQGGVTGFTLYDLQFGCRYDVQFQVDTASNEVSETTHRAFVTPSCVEVTVVGDLKPDCPSFGEL